MLGGTLFEYAFLHGKLDELFALVRATKMHIEVSDGSIDIPTADKLKWIERFAGVTEVWSEIGGKIALHVKDWGEVLRQEFGAGAKMIVVEGRQVGPVGQPIREHFVDEIARARRRPRAADLGGARASAAAVLPQEARSERATSRTSRRTTC